MTSKTFNGFASDRELTVKGYDDGSQVDLLVRRSPTGFGVTGIAIATSDAPALALAILEAAAAAARIDWSGRTDWDGAPNSVQIAYRNLARAAVSAYLAAALPEVTSVEELDQLPVGAVVYASNHIGPAEKFAVGWMGCGNNAAWSSQVLARDGLPARVLYRPSEQP